MDESDLLPKERDTSPSASETAEIVKLIRKLRWIGREDEARSMERRLMQLTSTDRDSVIAESCVTD